MPSVRLVALAFLCAGLSGCWVSKPRPDEWLATGFRGPKQALFTFQVAIRADEPELEYRCLSEDFRARNRISKLVWREAREQLRETYPWLRKGIADAQIVGPIEYDARGDRARALWETHGEWIRVDFRCEDFAELFSGETLVADDYVSFAEVTGTQAGPDGRRWFHGSVAIPSGDTADLAITELHVGREWKIDSFESIDPTEVAEKTREAANRRAEAPARENRYD